MDTYIENTIILLLIENNFSCKKPIRKFESRIITSITEETIKNNSDFLKKVSLFSKKEKLKDKIINFIISKNMLVKVDQHLLYYQFIFCIRGEIPFICY